MLNKVALILFAVCSTISTAYGAACTAAQLKGTFGSFRLPGGGGAYASGTSQVVSWSWPTGSPVTQIQSVLIRGSSNIALASVSGIPVNFISTQADQGGGINVVLPNPLAPGAYVFRVTLVSGGVQCTIDSAQFSVVSGNVINECNLNDSRCANNNAARQTCQNTPNGRRFSAPVNCPAGTACVQTGSTAQCTSSVPSGCNSADYGKFSCTPGNTGIRQCDRNANGGFSFVKIGDCPTGTTCKVLADNQPHCTF